MHLNTVGWNIPSDNFLHRFWFYIFIVKDIVDNVFLSHWLHAACCRLSRRIPILVFYKTGMVGPPAVFSDMVVRGVSQWPAISARQQMVVVANGIEWWAPQNSVCSFLRPQRRLCFCIRLLVGLLDYEESYGWIFVRFLERISFGTGNSTYLDFGMI